MTDTEYQAKIMALLVERAELLAKLDQRGTPVVLTAMDCVAMSAAAMQAEIIALFEQVQQVEVSA